jgi:hypothetical protein
MKQQRVDRRLNRPPLFQVKKSPTKEASLQDRLDPAEAYGGDLVLADVKGLSCGELPL